MPWPVFSEQFIRSTPAAGATVSYHVPAGMRAVVKSIDLVNSGALAGNVQIGVAGITVAYHTFQASDREGHQALMCVAYAGQEIQAYASVTGIRCNIAGFLFDDPAGAGDPTSDAESTVGPGPAWEPTPGTLPA